MKFKSVAYQLGAALAVATEIHKDQLDKGGAPYSLHPIRVMQRLRTDDYELMAIAVLHDALEDSEVDLKNEGFTQRIINGVEALTHVKDVGFAAEHGDEIEYLWYIENQVAPNRDALLVKIEDLRDNSDIMRLKGVQQKDFLRMQKYHKAVLFLQNYCREHY
jgi:(p)ppGpp synthase/HD superfamily hydrolase